MEGAISSTPLATFTASASAPLAFPSSVSAPAASAAISASALVTSTASAATFCTPSASDSASSSAAASANLISFEIYDFELFGQVSLAAACLSVSPSLRLSVCLLRLASHVALNYFVFKILSLFDELVLQARSLCCCHSVWHAKAGGRCSTSTRLSLSL